MGRHVWIACVLACPLLAQNGWNQLNPATAPAARENAAMAFDAARGTVVLFGGRGASGDVGDTWTWTPATNWVAATPSSVPSPRNSHAVVYDAARGVVLLFGGTSGGVQRNDTWIWDGTNWTQTGSNRPPAREGHVLAYDAARHRVVLFGGWSGTALLADHWEWDGTDWSQRTLSARPPARTGASAAWDTRQREVVLSGGWTGAFAGDSWAFDGTSWRQLTTAPGARALASVAEDPTRRNMILFGGLTGSPPAPSDETWIHDGASWALSPEPVRPPARSAHALCRNGRNGETLLFGGRGANALLGDTWLLRRPLAPNAAFAEAFSTDLMKDAAASAAGGWGGGQLLPGVIGGTGLLGDFEPQVREFVLNTDLQVFPADVTLSGREERVTNGEFHFASFRIPSGTTVRVVGSNPLRLFVRGAVEIAGELQLAAPDQPVHSYISLTGQPGGRGGAGGAAGGRGADRGNGLGNQPQFNGQDGSAVVLSLLHPYRQQSLATGGKGSSQFPTDGLNTSVKFDGWQNFASPQLAAGGGGGAFRGAGSNGVALFNGTNPPRDLGPSAPGGTAFDLLDATRFPLPPNNPGTRNLEFFLVGGAGGGGGGSDPHFSFQPTVIWRSGSGGAGGGGAVAVRAGADIAVAPSGTIWADGGSCPKAPPNGAHTAPGGGGSGGAILLQQGGANPSQLGLLSVPGGIGGIVDDRQSIWAVHTVGGNGGSGLARLELPMPQPPVQLIGRVDPPAGPNSVATLSDQDRTTGYRSKWFATVGNQVPEFLRYEVHATVSSVPVVYSDDPTVGRLARPGEAVVLYFQGALLDPVTREPLPGTLSRWTPYAGRFGAGNLNEMPATGMRFTLLFDRAVSATTSVQRLTVPYHIGPGRVDVYGTGCGRTEFTPHLSAQGGVVPRIGERFPLIADRMPPAQPAVLHIGASRTSWSGIPLPFDLTPLGAPNCFVLSSDEWRFALPNVTGRVLVNLQVPVDPGLRGLQFFGQVVALDPPANMLGVVLSNGLACTIE